MDSTDAVLFLRTKTASLSDDSAFIQEGCIKGWDSTTTLIQWDVHFRHTGQLNCALGIANDEDNIESSIKIVIGTNVLVGQTIFSGGWETFKPMPMGFVTIQRPGLYTITVQAQGISGVYAGDLSYVRLSGPAALQATEDPIPLQADAVHLCWGIEDPAVFYNSMSIVQSYPGTSFTACGSNDGYLGLQHLDFDGHKQVIFCVWDSYRGRSNDPDIAPDHHRAILIEKGDAITVDRFGKNGTGVKACFPYAWQKEEVYHFALEVQLTETSSQITGYFYINESNHWAKLATFRVRDDYRKFLTGIHSSIEDWKAGYGRHPRKAIFGPAWIYNAGDWKQVVTPAFTQSGSLKNTNIGVTPGLEKIFLTTGGRTEQDLKPGSRLVGLKLAKLPKLLNKLINH